MSDIVSAIIESADEIRNKERQDAQDFGLLLGYAEALSVIKDACDPDDWAEIGLDFDIDVKYLL